MYQCIAVHIQINEMESLYILSFKKFHRFPLSSWKLGENHRPGLASAKEAFTECIYAVHSQIYRKYGHSHDPLELPRMLPEFPDFSHAQLEQDFQASRNPIVWLGCLLMALKSVREGGMWKSETKLINWSFPRKCMQQNIQKLKWTKSNTITKQDWGRDQQGRRAVRTHYMLPAHICSVDKHG